ncbi:hypothetical protein [Lutispora thermophila]|nr:hypothetical protein [Lutispora thermophila]
MCIEGMNFSIGSYSYHIANKNNRNIIEVVSRNQSEKRKGR